jgi:hypothetical protein
MTRGYFEGQISELQATVICAVEEHFRQREIAFNIGRFLAESEVDLGQFLREAYFHGAEIFPVDTDQ